MQGLLGFPAYPLLIVWYYMHTLNIQEGNQRIQPVRIYRLGFELLLLLGIWNGWFASSKSWRSHLFVALHGWSEDLIVSVRVCMLTPKWHGHPFSTHFRSSSAFAILDAKPWGLLCPGPAVGSVSSECSSRNCCHSTENSCFILFSFLFSKLSSMIYAWFFLFHCPALETKTFI